MFRRLIATFSRYRPRALTLVVLAAIAGLLVLANLSEEISPRAYPEGAPRAKISLDFDLREHDSRWPWVSPTWNVSYGWPLLWRQYVIAGFSQVVLSENYGAGRLAANLAIWLAMLAVPAGACEWWLRHHRPRLRFSLRTMLAAICLTAALCAWFTSARNRANVQDPLIDAMSDYTSCVWIERWGPRWLDHFSADRFRRRIVGAQLEAGGPDEEDYRQGLLWLGELKPLPDLQSLSLTARRLTPEMAEKIGELKQLETLQIVVIDQMPGSSLALADAIRGMRRLRSLSIAPPPYTRPNADRDATNTLLAAISELPQLERLRLEGMWIEGEELAVLARLRSLKSLAFVDIFPRSTSSPRNPPLFSHLPALPHLEAIDVLGPRMGDGDLRSLAAMPRLKSLNLLGTNVTGAGLAELAPLECLEELTISKESLSSAGFESLTRLKRLRHLRIDYFDPESLQSLDALRHELADVLLDDEIDACVRAIDRLRQSNPKLMIGGFIDEPDWFLSQLPQNVQTIPDQSPRESFREAIRDWKEKRADQAADPGAVNTPAAK